MAEEKTAPAYTGPYTTAGAYGAVFPPFERTPYGQAPADRPSLRDAS